MYCRLLNSHAQLSFFCCSRGTSVCMVPYMYSYFRAHGSFLSAKKFGKPFPAEFLSQTHTVKMKNSPTQNRVVQYYGKPTVATLCIAMCSLSTPSPPILPPSSGSRHGSGRSGGTTTTVVGHRHRHSSPDATASSCASAADGA